MTIAQIEQFVTVCNCGSITLASQVLHLSQPSVSHAIIQLEKEFGVTLFIRTNNRIILTQEGKTFLTDATELLNRFRGLQGKMRDLGKDGTFLKIGMSHILDAIMKPVLIDSFRAKFPEFLLEVQDVNAAQAQQLILSDMMDIGIITSAAPVDARFEALTLKKTEFLCCMSADHPLAGEQELTPGIVENYPVILPSPSAVAFQNNYLNSYFTWHGCSFTNGGYCSEPDKTVQKLADGKSIAFLYREYVPIYPEIRCIPMKPAMNVDITLIWKKSPYVQKGIQRFIDYTEEGLDRTPVVDNRPKEGEKK